MDEQRLERSSYDLIWLVGCAVNRTVPDKQRLMETDLPLLFKTARIHMLTAAVDFALRSAGVSSPEFTEARGKSLKRLASVNMDMLALSERLEQEGIWYMPLKGAVLKDYYPEFGMREMSDCDILFDSSRAEDVKNIMLSLGFTVEEYGKTHHDVYMKPPVSCFEMHRSVYSEFYDPELYEYYLGMEKKLIPDENGGYRRHFSDEDLYIYLITHEYKHYRKGGTGLRSLLDCYVFLKAKSDTMDWNYIAGQTDVLGIREFEEKNRRLSLRVFSADTPDVEDEKELAYYLSSGVHGTKNHSVSNRVEKLGGGKKGRARYLMKRLFLPMDSVKMFYPFFYRHKLLLPALFLYRIGKSLTVSHNRLSAELAILKTTSEQK